MKIAWILENIKDKLVRQYKKGKKDGSL